ncbi:uncharacterized protein BKA78DRAFT_313639 [Phyllosticta capitalensis]|uniref:uncharacterized protein n=1 Tax=Phyllosticta capitalensis TaxID=121624 RepID=UPI00312E2D1A
MCPTGLCVPEDTGSLEDIGQGHASAAGRKWNVVTCGKDGCEWIGKLGRERAAGLEKATGRSYAPPGPTRVGEVGTCPGEETGDAGKPTPTRQCGSTKSGFTPGRPAPITRSEDYRDQ